LAPLLKGARSGVKTYLPARPASEMTRVPWYNRFINRISAFLPCAGRQQADGARLGLVDGKPSRVRKLVLRSSGIQQRHYAIIRKPVRRA
jgi:hypothetical protein